MQKTMNTSSTRITPLPVATMPHEMLASSVWEMEPGERQFIRACSIFPDRDGRVWVNAATQVSVSSSETFDVQVRRTEDGVELRIPCEYGFVRQLESPFRQILPVTKIEIIEAENCDV